MGDMGDTFRSWNAFNKRLREQYGVPCPECRRLQPKREPTIMLPGQRCKVDRYRDPRPRLTEAQTKLAGDWVERKRAAT